MVLDAEGGFSLDADAFQGAVEERRVGLDDASGQAIALDDEAVVLRGDFDPAGFQILDRMVRATVAHVHLGCAGAHC